jgi:hypothetical protein
VTFPRLKGSAWAGGIPICESPAESWGLGKQTLAVTPLTYREMRDYSKQALKTWERAYVNAAPGGVLSVQFVSDGRIVSVGRTSASGARTASPRRASPPSGALLTKVTSSCDAKYTIASGLRGTDTQLGRQ